MLRYPSRATPGIVRIYKRFNRITIFVEDSTYTNVYRIFFERVLGSSDKIRKIFPLNGRQSVIDACVNGRYSKYKAKLFLIDGDLELLRGDPGPSHPELHRLGAYCCENLFICEEAAIELAFESSPSRTKGQLAQSLQFGLWLADVVEKLFPLFVMYAAAQNFSITVETVGYSVERLISTIPNPKGKSLAKRLLKKRMKEIESKILQSVSKSELDRYIESIIIKASTDIDGRSKYISGKNYLLPLLYRRLRSRTRFRDQLAAFPIRLSKHAKFDVDPVLVSKLKALAGIA